MLRWENWRLLFHTELTDGLELIIEDMQML